MYIGTDFAPLLLGGFFSPLPTFPEGVVRPIVLNGVQCSGTESELSECDRAEFISSCSRTTDVGIHCGEIGKCIIMSFIVSPFALVTDFIVKPRRIFVNEYRQIK